MRTLMFTAPSESAELTTVGIVPEPRPGRGEVSIAVEYSGINFIDVMARRGDAAYVLGCWPHHPGHEVAGRVRRVGLGVEGFAEGDRVTALTGGGGLAEVAVARAALTVTVPDAVELDVAAAVPLGLGTSLLLLTHAARFAPGERVLVHSPAGGVGSAIPQLVDLVGGGTTTGVVGSRVRLQTVLDHGYDSAHIRNRELGAEVVAAQGPLDVVLDPHGTNMVGTDLEVLRPGGRVVLFGNASGSPLGALPEPGRLMGGNASIAGFSLTRLAAAAPDVVAAATTQLLDWLAHGQLAIATTVVSGLPATAAVHQRMAERRSAGKHVVAIDPSVA